MTGPIDEAETTTRSSSSLVERTKSADDITAQDEDLLHLTKQLRRLHSTGSLQRAASFRKRFVQTDAESKPNASAIRLTRSQLNRRKTLRRHQSSRTLTASSDAPRKPRRHESDPKRLVRRSSDEYLDSSSPRKPRRHESDPTKVAATSRRNSKESGSRKTEQSKSKRHESVVRRGSDKYADSSTPRKPRRHESDPTKIDASSRRSSNGSTDKRTSHSKHQRHESDPTKIRVSRQSSGESRSSRDQSKPPKLGRQRSGLARTTSEKIVGASDEDCFQGSFLGLQQNPFTNKGVDRNDEPQRPKRSKSVVRNNNGQSEHEANSISESKKQTKFLSGIVQRISRSHSRRTLT